MRGPLLAVHLLSVMTLFGTALMTDSTIAAIRRNAADAPALSRQLHARNLPVERAAAWIALATGIAMVGINPGLMATGPWIHGKLGCGLLAIVLLLASRAAWGPEGPARWAAPVRGFGMLLAVGAVVCATVLR